MQFIFLQSKILKTKAIKKAKIAKKLLDIHKEFHQINGAIFPCN